MRARSGECVPENVRPRPCGAICPGPRALSRPSTDDVALAPVAFMVDRKRVSAAMRCHLALWIIIGQTFIARVRSQLCGHASRFSSREVSECPFALYTAT
jgi:hypothetical protein